MPTIGGFHAKFWKTRANGAGPGGTAARWMYPQWQASIITMSASFVGGCVEALWALWARLQWTWRLHRRLQVSRLTDAQLAVLERAVTLMQSPFWANAEQAVQVCATTPKFHQSQQWVEYSRALKANAGQAQNVFRHIKVVRDLVAAHPALTNPEAHFLAELAYQGFARIERRDVKIVHHASRHIEHPKTLVIH